MLLCAEDLDLQGPVQWDPKFQHGGKVPTFEHEDTIKI